MSESCLDDALTTRITKLANFVAQKGDAMEQMVRTKNGADPDWAFLFGGEGADFYMEQKQAAQESMAEQYRQQMMNAPLQ